ncbi:hypothetical protein KP509_38G042400 [Ceratopteris richardii]|uniref:SAC domain-containing protein n=1 Tax=Ceratopteris richardii TaxID=49495 RepID=A0A8T2Q519_CERRI|nr:hypothetical protein KP509_38G042400 [Ceratopteris richardii]KAH7278463.1 hypothetical protein KP509_38G042400 [Ceratopteris richardii]
MTAYEFSLPQSEIKLGSSNHPHGYPLTKLMLYETTQKFYLVGTDKFKKHWKILKIDRCDPTKLNIFEDPTDYTQHDCNDLLIRLNAGNKSTGGLKKFVTKAYSVLGFIQFVETYYILLLTKRRLLGTISGFPIYGVAASRLISIAHPLVQAKIASSQLESRYKKLFNSIDLTKDFFFSYDYRVMWSLQKNVLEGEMDRIPYEDMFVWNAFITSCFHEQVKNLQWSVALVHGFFKQIKLFDNGSATVTLIARRSRHYAGTRYLKRGVNEKGQVANEVETEQLVQEESEGKVGQISSIVQHRGSIPLFWYQETSVLSPRPEIKLKREDFCYRATKIHFDNLASRYGNPIIAFNLIKEYENAIAFLNQNREQKIKLLQWDFHTFARNGCKNVLQAIGMVATDALNQVGFYCSSKPIRLPTESQALEETSKRSACIRQHRKTIKLQKGVLRTNCIDCLDRTNVAQFSFGLAALGQQIQALRLHQNQKATPESKVGLLLMHLYEEMGDALALQYGGSNAHNTILSNSQGKWKAATQSLDLLRSIKRHYSNSYTDGLKQDAINVFLGHSQPEVRKQPVGQFDSDDHLHFHRMYDSFAIEKAVLKKFSSMGGILKDQTAVLKQALPFMWKKLGGSSGEHCKEMYDKDSQSTLMIQATITCKNREKSLSGESLFSSKHNQRIFPPILIIPENDEDFKLSHSNEDSQRKSEETEELWHETFGTEVNWERDRTFEEKCSLAASVNLERKLCILKHTLNYKDTFERWVRYGGTIF